MSIEIVAHEVCPTCKGTGEWEQQTVLGPMVGPCIMCDEETRTVPRVLATFAGAAALGVAIRTAVKDRLIDSMSDDYLGDDEYDGIRDRMLAALGVTDVE